MHVSRSVAFVLHDVEVALPPMYKLRREEVEKTSFRGYSVCVRTRSEVKNTSWKDPRLKPILYFAPIQQPKGCCSLRFVYEKLAEASSHADTKAP